MLLDLIVELVRNDVFGGIKWTLERVNDERIYVLGGNELVLSTPSSGATEHGKKIK